MRIIIGFAGMPKTGSGLMTPTTGFSGVATREIARENRIRATVRDSGSRNGIACFASS